MKIFQRLILTFNHYTLSYHQKSKMSNYIIDQEIANVPKLNFVLLSVITKLVSQSLDNIINRTGNVSSLLDSIFKFKSMNNKHIKHVKISLEIYKRNNSTFPDSLSKLNLDITNLLAIRTNFMDASSDPLEFFKSAGEIRNGCSHSTRIPDVTFSDYCEKLRKLVYECPYLKNDEKEIYLKDLNYILKHLVINDDQFLKQDQNADQAIIQINQDIEEKLNLITKTVTNVEKKNRELEQKINILKDQNCSQEKRIKSIESETKNNSKTIGNIRRAMVVRVKVRHLGTDHQVSNKLYNLL